MESNDSRKIPDRGVDIRHPWPPLGGDTEEPLMKDPPGERYPQANHYVVGTLQLISLDINQPSLPTPFILFFLSSSVSTAL